MPVRTAYGEWDGTLKEGEGRMSAGSGAFDVEFTYASRFEEEPGTNPEELLGAAHAGCFSMYLSGLLSDEGYTDIEIRTSARIHLREGPRISRIELTTEAEVPNLDEKTFLENVEKSKKNCPVSLALTEGPEIVVRASLVGQAA